MVRNTAKECGGIWFAADEYFALITRQDIIDANQAFVDRIKFYLGNETVFLTDYIAPKSLTIHQDT